MTAPKPTDTATNTPATRPEGIQLYCPHCREPSANVKLHLWEPECFLCEECGEEFDRGDIEAMLEGLAKWKRVLAWIDTMPSEEVIED